MKTIRYILCAVAVCAALASCIKEPVGPIFSDREGVGLQMKFNLLVVDPEIRTRSLAADLADENQIRDLNIFVFDAETGMLDGYAYAAQLTGGTGTECVVRGTSGTRTLVVVANIGRNISAGVSRMSDLEKHTGSAFIVDGYAVMSGALPDVEVTPPDNGDNGDNGDDGDDESWVVDVGEIVLQRLMAKVTVVLDKSGLNADNEYESFTVELRSVQLKQVPGSFTYIRPNTASVRFGDGDYIYTGDGDLEPADHDSAIPLYMPENMQGAKTPSPGYEHYILGDTLDLGPRYTSPVTMVPEPGDIGKCSYVELVADYDNYKNVPGGGEAGAYGTVVYKIFLGSGLGEQIWNNFDVRRNTWYKVTVKLSGQAGKLEASWRIETDLNEFMPDPDDPAGHPGSYTIKPEDSLYWTIEASAPAWRTYSDNNQNLAANEYYEGRWSSYHIVQNAGNLAKYPAMDYCQQFNTGTDIDQILYYLPSQNELQMLNIHRNSVFEDGIYWSSTQLQSDLMSNANRYARVINYSNFGEAYTQSKGTSAIVRCLRVPDRSSDPDWDGKTYPYIDDAEGYPAIVNRDTNPDGTPRGVKSFALRSGRPYERLTPYYHTVTKPYKAFRVAKSDCGPDGEPVASGSAPLNWYEAMGYVPMSAAEEVAAGADYAPTANTTRTGCNAYYEDGDLSQRGKWRVPTSLELQQLWIMGASSYGSRPADPSAPQYLDAAGNVAARLPGITELNIPGYNQVFGDISTLLNNMQFIADPTGPAYPLTNCYWSSSTTFMSGGNIYENNAYAYKMDLYSGDGYSGIESFLARPSKQEGGLVRCVMDVEK